MKRWHYSYWIVVACAAIYSASVGIIVSCAGLLYRAVAEEFQVGVSEISLYTSIMYATVTVLLPLAGYILKRYDVRLILSISGVLNATAFGLMGTYHSVFPFYISGVMLGIGSTFLIYGTIPLIINQWFKTKVSTALGIAMAFMGIGGAIFAQVTGVLIENVGWRSTYIILGCIVALLILPFTIFVIRMKPEQLNMQPFGTEQVTAEDVILSQNDGVTKQEAMEGSAFYFIMIFTGILGLISTVSFHVPNFMQSIGFSAALAATGVTCITIGQLVGKFLLGVVNDKFGIRMTLIIGIGGGIVGIIGMFISYSLGLWILYLGALLFGIGFSSSTFLPPLIIRQVFGNKDYATIYTTIMSLSTLGVAVGTTLFSYMYDQTGSYEMVFIVVLLLLIIAIVLSFISLKWRKKATNLQGEITLK